MRRIELSRPMSLAKSAGPVAWGGGRWPSFHWSEDTFWWAGTENGETVWRSVRQTGPQHLVIEGTADSASDADWLNRVLGEHQSVPSFDDPLLDGLARQHHDLRPFSDGGLWEGLISAIVGQGVTVASGATMLARVAAMHHDGLALGDRTLWPLPEPGDLAEDTVERLRGAGLTRQRCETLIAAAQLWRVRPDLWVEGADEAEQDRALLAVRGIGPWSVAAARLWGLAEPDAHPTGDVALLRAARLALAEPGMTLRELDRIAERWRPHRAWAARLLWHELFGGDSSTETTAN